MRGYKPNIATLTLSFLAFFMLLTTQTSLYAQYLDENPNRYRFTYKSETYKGTRVQITDKLAEIKNDSKFTNIPDEIEEELHSLFTNAKRQPIPKIYKKHAIEKRHVCG